MSRKHSLPTPSALHRRHSIISTDDSGFSLKEGCDSCPKPTPIATKPTVAPNSPKGPLRSRIATHCAVRPKPGWTWRNAWTDRRSASCGQTAQRRIEAVIRVRAQGDRTSGSVSVRGRKRRPTRDAAAFPRCNFRGRRPISRQGLNQGSDIGLAPKLVRSPAGNRAACRT